MRKIEIHERTCSLLINLKSWFRYWKRQTQTWCPISWQRITSSERKHERDVFSALQNFKVFIESFSAKIFNQFYCFRWNSIGIGFLFSRGKATGRERERDHQSRQVTYEMGMNISVHPIPSMIRNAYLMDSIKRNSLYWGESSSQNTTTS